MKQTTDRLKRKAEIALAAAQYSYARLGDLRQKQKADKLGQAFKAMESGMNVFAALEVNGCLEYVE